MRIVDLSRFAELEKEIVKDGLDMSYLWCYFMNSSKKIEVFFDE